MEELTPRQAAERSADRMEALAKQGLKPLLQAINNDLVLAWEAVNLTNATLAARMLSNRSAVSDEAFQWLLDAKEESDQSMGHLITCVHALHAVVNEGEPSLLAEAFESLSRRESFRANAVDYFETVFTSEERSERIQMIQRMFGKGGSDAA